MKTSTRAAVLASAALVVALAATVAVIALQNPAPSSDPATTPISNLVGDSTHLLAEADTGVVLVEFADFQCPSCAAFHPYLEQLHTEFAGEVTFAFRHFPLPQHAHAIDAAVAAEAAARQGLFAEMHDALFSTQAQWAELADASGFFRQLAGETGLDLERYDTDITDAELLRTVEADADAGIEAGVRSTPSFFLDGVPLQLQSYDDLRDALVAATSD